MDKKDGGGDVDTPKLNVVDIGKKRNSEPTDALYLCTTNFKDGRRTVVEMTGYVAEVFYDNPNIIGLVDERDSIVPDTFINLDNVTVIDMKEITS